MRVTRKLFTADLMGLMLIVLALQAFTYGISASLRNTDTGNFFRICLLAMLISLGLSKSNSHPIQASAGIVALGAVVIWILAANLSFPLLDLVKSILSIFPQVIPALRSKTVIDTSAIRDSWGTIQLLSSTLVIRLQTWLSGMNENITVRDALGRNMIWALSMWLVSAWVGWFAGRRNAILALSPCIFLLAAITSYSGNKVEALWLIVFVMLLLMGMWNYKSHIQHWERRRVDYSESIQLDFSLSVFGMAVMIGAVAFVTPSISLHEIREYLRERDQISENKTADLLGIQEPSGTTKNESTQKPALPREHLLSGGFAQSQDIVMTIRTGELPPVPISVLVENVPSYYWRSVTYDVYAGAGWITSPAPPQRYQADTPLIPGLLNGYRLIHLDVQLQEPEGKLFWSGILFSADIPFTANWRVKPNSSLFADQAALLQADMFAATTKATSYKAESYIPDVTIAELHAASSDYPEEILKRYLALPPSVPARVSELAQKITQGQSTPYDKAKAIESYLRINYPYDLEIPAPPPDQDVVDYFLFDLKKGYCDYFATAMVVLARLNGIPARFVSGYSPGSYDSLNAEYIIRELNAHSWAEVYFPEIGWVEFEPTGSVPEIIRAETENPVSAEQTDSTASQLLYRFRLEKIVYFSMPLFILLVFVLLYFTVLERWWVLRMAPATAIERIYRKFYRAGRPFAGARTRSETAHEFANKLLHKLNELDERSIFNKLLASLKNNASTLSNLYDSALFRDVHIQKNDSHTAWRTWTHLRWRLLFARILLYRVREISKTNRTWLQEQ